LETNSTDRLIVVRAEVVAVLCRRNIDQNARDLIVDAMLHDDPHGADSDSRTRLHRSPGRESVALRRIATVA
jgi:hypothetical protein